MINLRRPADYWQLLRYYQAGLVNMAFGYLLFALLVWLGLQIYVAQAVAHAIGVGFNYLTYSRYTFSGHSASKTRFVLSYIGNYALGLAALWAALQLVQSPYLAGLIGTVAVSIVNYFILKRLVFRAPADATGQG